MQPSIDTTGSLKRSWTYASLAVMDGLRELKPAQVAFDRLLFREPPHVISSRVEIILINGDAEQRSMAIVLPHAPNATRIPIQLCHQDAISPTV